MSKIRKLISCFLDWLNGLTIVQKRTIISALFSIVISSLLILIKVTIGIITVPGLFLILFIIAFIFGTLKEIY